MKTTEELKQEYLESDREYQYALASGDKDRLQTALSARRKAWNAFNKAKKVEFNAKGSTN